MLAFFWCSSPCMVINNSGVHTLILGLSCKLLALQTWWTNLLSVLVLMEIVNFTTAPQLPRTCDSRVLGCVVRGFLLWKFATRHIHLKFLQANESFKLKVGIGFF